MTITYDWRIANLEHEAKDGYVFTAHWTVSATDSVANPNDPEGNPYTAGTYGSVGLERPDNLIPYENLTETTVVGWVKEKFGAEQVASTEAALAAQIAEQKNPSKESGVPW